MIENQEQVVRQTRHENISNVTHEHVGDAASGEGETSLGELCAFELVLDGNIEGLCSLLEFNPSYLSSCEDTKGASLLHYPIDGRTAEFLVTQALISVNKRDNEGNSPLHEAAKRGYEEVVSILILHGALVNSEDVTGVHPIHIASANGFYSIVGLLLDAGADINELGSLPSQIAAPLHHAAFCGNKEVVKLLLSRGANILLCGKDGRSVMVYGSYSGDEGLLTMLLDHGAIPLASPILWQEPYAALMGAYDSYKIVPPSSVRSVLGDSGSSLVEDMTIQQLTWTLTSASSSSASFPAFLARAAAAVSTMTEMVTKEEKVKETADNVTLTSNELSVYLCRGLLIHPPSSVCAVARACFDIEATIPNIKASNQGGYHSLMLAFEEEMTDPALQSFYAMLASAISQIPEIQKSCEGKILHEWVNISRNGHFNACHDHVPSKWSGVYYAQLPPVSATATAAVLLGEEKNLLDSKDQEQSDCSGALALKIQVISIESSKSLHSTGSSSSTCTSICEHYLIKPETGLLVLFRGSLPHAVYPLTCDDGQARVSISFNIE